MGDEIDDKAAAGEACGVIPAGLLAERGHGENGEDGQRDYFLNRFELGSGEIVGTDSVRWNLEAILKKRNTPTRENYFPRRFAAEFQVAVPGESLEDVGNREKKNGAYVRIAP